MIPLRTLFAGLALLALNSAAFAQANNVTIKAPVPLPQGAATESTVGDIAAAVHSGSMYATPANAVGVPFETDPPTHYDAINITLSTSSQSVVPARTVGTDTRHGLELQFIGTGYVYCRWGAAATVNPGGYNMRLAPELPVWTMQLLPNGPPQAQLQCIGSTTPAVSGSLVGTEYYK